LTKDSLQILTILLEIPSQPCALLISKELIREAILALSKLRFTNLVLVAKNSGGKTLSVSIKEHCFAKKIENISLF